MDIPVWSWFKGVHCHQFWDAWNFLPIPGDSSRDRLIPQLEVTNNLSKGHLTIPKRSQSQNCQVYIYIYLEPVNVLCSFGGVFTLQKKAQPPFKTGSSKGSRYIYIYIYNFDVSKGEISPQSETHYNYTFITGR